jgi:sec-independent protein translocase protein TatC
LLKAASAEGLEPRNALDGPQESGGRLRLPDNPEEFRATLVEHLEELRTRIVRSLMIIAGGWLLGWYLEKPAFGWLSRLVLDNIAAAVHNPNLVKIVFTNYTEPFMLKIRLSFMIGLIFAMPFVVMQLWGFVKPGLKPQERRPLERLAPFSMLLFAIGVCFCMAILGPCTRWFSSYLEEFPNTVLYQDPAAMISFCLKMMLAFGLGFQLPLVVWALGALNLLSAETLTKYWRHAAVAIFFLAAAFTPSNDAFSMLMMAIPMVVLFSISVWAVKITQGKRKMAPTVLDKDGG